MSTTAFIIAKKIPVSKAFNTSYGGVLAKRKKSGTVTGFVWRLSGVYMGFVRRVSNGFHTLRQFLAIININHEKASSNSNEIQMEFKRIPVGIAEFKRNSGVFPGFFKT